MSEWVGENEPINQSIILSFLYIYILTLFTFPYTLSSLLLLLFSPPPPPFSPGHLLLLVSCSEFLLDDSSTTFSPPIASGEVLATPLIDTIMCASVTKEQVLRMLAVLLKGGHGYNVPSVKGDDGSQASVVESVFHHIKVKKGGLIYGWIG